MGYLEGTEPDLASKVKLYTEEISLFERFHVDDQIRKALDRKVWLESGGHIVIERTEALTVVDVNTGKFVGHSNLEDTVLRNNLEAAEEIAHQLRLRDIGGIIVIDFIDMEILGNRRQVLERLRSHLAKDRTRTQVFDVSELGLVEMTRKNVSAGLVESFSEICEHCGGRGVVLFEEAATTGRPMPGTDAALETGVAAS
jgi:ribonuclease E